MSVTIPQMAAWEMPEKCTDGPEPGAKAFLAYWLEQQAPLARSLGIYNCRTVRGGTTRSVHGEGRAIDCGVPVNDEGHAVMWEFLNRIAPHAKRLGVCLVIFDRTMWSAIRDPKGEPYRGVHPHRDHAHIELTRASARKLTLATLRSVVGDWRPEESAPVSPPVSAPKPKPEPEGVVPKMKQLDLSKVTDARSTWVRSDRVKVLQGAMMADGETPQGLVDDRGRPDGVAGPATREKLGRVQRRHKTGRKSSPATPDFVVGEKTWSALLLK